MPVAASRQLATATGPHITQPESFGPVIHLSASTSPAAFAALLTVALSIYALYAWRQSRSMREQISLVRSEIDKLARERAAGVALLNQPQKYR